jgi:hypothetical protein
MDKPLISRWYIKLTLLLLIIAVAYLVVKSFNTGKEEGKQMRQAHEATN